MLSYYVLVKDTNLKVVLVCPSLFLVEFLLFTFLYSFELKFLYCIKYVPLNTCVILFLPFCENIAILFLHSSAILLCFMIENLLCLFPVLVR